MSNASLKGEQLETAVKGIEEAILRHSPGLRENTFLIESKKVIVVEGVRHEIDVWVEIDVAKGYRSVFIFECKNWDAKVGKNEIIIFSEKIRSAQAQRGYFVARTFTADAKAQALTDPRVGLLTATQRDPRTTPVPFDFHQILNEIRHVDVKVQPRRLRGDTRHRPIILDNAQCDHQGHPGSFKTVMESLAHEAVNRRSRSIPSGRLAAGDYDYSAAHSWKYRAGEMIIGGIAIARVSVRVTFVCRILRPPIVSHFDVETRGRYYGFAPIVVPGLGTINWQIVEIQGPTVGGR